MRIDKFLKVSRLIKRRTAAAEACDAGRIMVGDKVVKPSYDVKVGDIITIGFGDKAITVRVLKLLESTKKEDAESMFEAIIKYLSVSKAFPGPIISFHQPGFLSFSL